MDISDKCRVLADAIRAGFRDGITLDSQTRHYIAACFSDFPLAVLAGRMSDWPDHDLAPLMELIFFPDEAFQMRLEPLLSRYAFDTSDERRVTDLLQADPLLTALRETGDSPSVPIQVPAPVIGPFARRLKISRQIPFRLTEMINRRHPSVQALRLRVMLRNARFPFAPAVTDFLLSFFRGMDPEESGFHDCLGLALSLLAEGKPPESPEGLLQKKMEALHAAKAAAAAFERQLHRSNMETLMHQGVRAPEIGSAEAEEKIVLLLRIARAVHSGKKSSHSNARSKMAPL